MRDRGEKLNNSEIGFELSQEAQGSIFYYKKDVNNVWRGTLFHVIKEMRVVCGGR